MRRRFDVAWLVFWGVVVLDLVHDGSPRTECHVDEPLYCSRTHLLANRKQLRPDEGRHDAVARGRAIPADPPCGNDAGASRSTSRSRRLPHHPTLCAGSTSRLLVAPAVLRIAPGAIVRRSEAGRFAVVLQATEPSLLGHACLATTDIAVTAMILVFAYHYDRGRDGSRMPAGPARRPLWPGDDRESVGPDVRPDHHAGR